jgi:hypothetical protein
LVGGKEEVGRQIINIKPVMLKNLSIPIIHANSILEPAQALTSSDILPRIHSHQYMKILVILDVLDLLLYRPVALFLVQLL